MKNECCCPIKEYSGSMSREDMVDFGVLLFANIHLCGSVLTEVFFCMIVSKVLYGTLPDIQTLVLFCVLLAIFALQDSFGTACNVTGDGALAFLNFRK